jgi:hypothetical protein
MHIQNFVSQPSKTILDRDGSPIQRLIADNFLSEAPASDDAGDETSENLFLDDAILMGRIFYRLLLASAALLFVYKELFGHSLFAN